MYNIVSISAIHKSDFIYIYMLYSTGNYIQYLGKNHDGEKYLKVYVCTCTYIHIHFQYFKLKY